MIYDLPSGAAGSELTLTMQVEFSVLYASASDLTELASLALNASIPSGFISVTDAVTFDPVTNPLLLEEGTIRWTMRAEREIFQKINTAYKDTEDIVALVDARPPKLGRPKPRPAWPCSS